MMRESKTLQIDRRQFLKVSFIAGIGLIVAVHVPAGSGAASSRGTLDNGVFIPNAWIRIDPDGVVTVISKHSELGQGTTTGLSMIVAEELEADWSKIRSEIAPVAPEYKNPEMGVQATGGSTGIKTSWDTLRQAGATVREMLMSAASEIWKVPVQECRTEKGTVIHESTGRFLGYGQLIEKASTVPVPEAPRLKKPENFQIIGKPFPRLDTPDKTKGRTVYGIDLNMPDLLVATVVHPPVFGSRLKAMDDRRARAMPGIRRILSLDRGVAVIGETFYQVHSAAETLKLEWDIPEQSRFSSRDLMARFEKRLKGKGIRVRDEGDAEGIMKQAFIRLKADYEVPYQAHICPEPMNCTAHVRHDRCDVWAPTQGQETAQEVAARITDLPLKKVLVHTPFIGGGFGRRYNPDFVEEAVLISKQMKTPVKVIWSREEDMRNDYYRPAFFNRIEAGLDTNGLPIALIHKAVGQAQMDRLIEIVGPSILPKKLPASIRYALAGLLVPLAKRFMIPKETMSGSVDMAYGIENLRVELFKEELPVPVGAWRSVGDSRNAFVIESFMDEIAAAGKNDPVELRERILQDAPRHLRVLRLAADKAGWGKGLPEARHRGIALHAFHGTPVAMVAEVSVEDDGNIKIHRVVSAVDCGTAVNPALVDAQIKGGILFGLTATLKSSVHIVDGRVMESNFDDFPIMRMDETPKIEVHIVESTEPPGGIGESPVPPVAPAVTNAVFAATGKRIRRIPVDPGELM